MYKRKGVKNQAKKYVGNVARNYACVHGRKVATHQVREYAKKYKETKQV